MPKTEFIGMGNPRFFAVTGPHSLATIAAAAGCEVPEEAPKRNELFVGLASLDIANPDQVSFLGDPRHTIALEQTRAGAVIVRPDMVDRVPQSTAPLIATNPFFAWAGVAALFHPVPPVLASVHPSAVIASDAAVDATAEICAQSVIGARAEIGPRCRIGPGTVIGDGVVMGPDCLIGANVTISHSIIGARVCIFPGARIGQDGFGFTFQNGGFLTTPQLGCVVLEDDVQIGANTTIDRGALRDTVIGMGTRLDNLVQVGHNVRIGRYCAIAGQVGISGSTDIGDFVSMGGQAGVADHIVIGSKAKVGAQAGVMSDIKPDSVVIGSPARLKADFFREIATLKKLGARKPSPETRSE
jgi:UDP-3-O-[3-hydroxymyristoyl] glucosamine N-acyltransferase